MEDILNKNIFDDKYLHQLSPDYDASNLLIRMQMRRTMVKDTHKHEVQKSTNIPRKNIKRVKDASKVTKEILKLRNCFNNINLKNQIMLKNAIKQTDSLKAKTLPRDEDDFNNTVPYLKEISDEMDNLVICNDTDFKINNKSVPKKLANEIKRHGMRRSQKYSYNDSEKCDYKKNSECYAEEAPQCEISVEYKPAEIDHVRHKEPDIDLDLTSAHNGFDKQVDDLQTLLIMMAISPKSNENSEYEVMNSSTCFNDGNDNTEVTPPNFAIIPNSKEPEDFNAFLSISQMKIVLSDRHTYILRKYVEKWRVYVAYKKTYLLQQRQATLNSFFDKLAKKKQNMNNSLEQCNAAKILARDHNTYQHRYKVQKHIIALQKVKLEEQNRVIEELKYNKIVEASRLSVGDLREKVRKTYFEIDRQLKPKIKCLRNELKLHEIEEPSLVLHCLKVPQFLQRMEKRAREREEKHAMIRERREQMEEERVRLKQQAELAKSEMDKEEKMKRIKELKEKRKKEKMESIRKKQYAERMRALIVMADLHYERYLLAHYGIQPFRRLIELKRDNLEKSKAHFVFQLKKNVFLHWMWFTEDMWFERTYKATEFYRKKLLKKVFDSLKKNHNEYVLKKQVAEDYHDLYVTQFGFRKIREGLDVIRKEEEIKWNKVILYHNSNLLFKTFTCWRSLPALNALKREQEARKARWREKVLQVVPDYTPPDD